MGATVDWANLAPGEYEIGLTVTNNVEMTDSTTIRGTSAMLVIGTTLKSEETTAAILLNWILTPSSTMTKTKETPL